MGLSHGDLKGTVSSLVTIDHYQAKSGTDQEVIVVGLIAIDKDPANDLNRFIQRGTSELIDTEVSPNPDVEGNYVVFAEFKRSPDFQEEFYKLLKDIENVTGVMDWTVHPYLAPEPFPYEDTKKLNKYVVTKPGSVKDKKEMKETMNIEKEIIPYFKNSFLSALTIKENYVIFTHDHYKRVAGNIVDFGTTNDVMFDNDLYESATSLFDIPTEISMLDAVLGEGWDVSKIGKYVAISNNMNDKVLLLDQVQIVPNGYKI